MSNLKSLKQNINLLNYIQKTLESIESIQINQRTILNKNKSIHSHLLNMFNDLSFLITIPKNKKKLLLIMGSDSSLCGVYNSSLVKFFPQVNYSIYDKIIVIGKKIKKINGIGNDFEYCSFKEFMTLDLNKYYYDYGFNIDVLGYHNKFISINNLSNNINLSPQSKPNNFIIEIKGTTINELYFQWLLTFTIYKIQEQENLQRLVFLKTALDNCHEEIHNKTQEYRSKRQENITAELNELISANLDD